MNVKEPQKTYQPPRAGLYLLYGLITFLFMLFILRFWYLQVLKGSEYTNLAQTNRTRHVQLYPMRGIITDRTGIILAENRPSFCLAIIPEDCQDIPATLAKASQLTNTPLEQIQSTYEQERKSLPIFMPILLVTDLNFEDIALLEPVVQQIPGLSIEPRQRRHYPQAELLAHIIGYVAEANPSEVSRETGVELGDRIGKLGLELTMEDSLKGYKGNAIIEADVNGRQMSIVQTEPAISGNNIALSIDYNLQQAASDALGAYSGCIVVMEPATGQVLALLTKPAFDNNLFTSKLSEKDWAALRDNPAHPMQNRAIQSMYPPGSVWKLMMAGLLLEAGVNPQQKVVCRGSTSLGNRVFRCWKQHGHGAVDLMQALVESCDVYFYEKSQEVGIDKIEEFAKASGFGRLTGVDLPYEKAGLVPGKNWKRNRPPYEEWQQGETLNVSIGQGATLITPLQMATFVSALLNGGELLKPQLLLDAQKEITAALPMKEKSREFVVEAMRRTAEVGTARVIKRADAIMGGKTGTAQVVRIGEKRLKTAEMAYFHRDHAWLVSYGKKEDKAYVVVVLVEHGGGGSSTAGPITAKIYETLFGPVSTATQPLQTSTTVNHTNTVKKDNYASVKHRENEQEQTAPSNLIARAERVRWQGKSGYGSY